MTTDPEYSLQNEIALVTGSGRGLGHAIAIRLAELGASVAIHDINDSAPSEFGEFQDLAASEGDVAKLGGRTTRVTGDISDEARVMAIAKEIEASLGPVTILVNA